MRFYELVNMSLNICANLLSKGYNKAGFRLKVLSSFILILF